MRLAPKVQVVLALLTACGGSGALSPSDSAGSRQTSATLPEWYKAFAAAGMSVTVDGNFVVISTTDVPDHKSPYFATTSAQYEAYNGTNKNFVLNPNRIAAQQMTFRIPIAPTKLSTPSPTPLGPTTTRNIASLLRDTRGDDRIQILSHSIAPAADSVGALAHFAAERGIRDPRWHLLTGDSASIDSLARRSYFVRLGSDTTYGVKSIAHSESILLVDGEGRLRGVYAGTLQLEMDRIKEDVETLLAEQLRQSS